MEVEKGLGPLGVASSRPYRLLQRRHVPERLVLDAFVAVKQSAALAQGKQAQGRAAPRRSVVLEASAKHLDLRGDSVRKEGAEQAAEVDV